MGTYLDTFEVIVRTSAWPRAQWPIYLREYLSGTSVTALPASQQDDYTMVK